VGSESPGTLAAAVEVVKRILLLTIFLAGCQKHQEPVRMVLQPPSTNNYPSYFAQWLGFYKEEGIEVSISQVAGAAKVLEAVVGGSADVGGGVYEQTIQMAAEGKSIVSFISLLKSPNFAILAAPGVRKLSDLRGKTVGVSSVGSPSQFYLVYLLQREGITDVSTANVGMGASAVAALERGQVDAAVLFGSAIPAFLARKPDAAILADTRTPEGLRAAFDTDDYPASCLLAQKEWLDANPESAKKIAKAVLRSLAWIREHSPEEILLKVPQEVRAGDVSVEIAAIRLAQPMYSVDGHINMKSAEAVRAVQSSKWQAVDLSRTFLNLP
jgi:NitT/TauT family transport system substrate-binding protein